MIQDRKASLKMVRLTMNKWTASNQLGHFPLRHKMPIIQQKLLTFPEKDLDKIEIITSINPFAIFSFYKSVELTLFCLINIS